MRVSTWLNAIAVVTALSSNTWAQSPVASVRDWNLVVDADSRLETTVCRAYTQVSKSEVLGAELSLSFAQDSSRWPIFLLKVPAQASKPALALLHVSSREAHPMFLLRSGVGEQDQDFYWLAPVDQPKAASLIAAASKLEITLDPQGAKIPLKFSLAGSSVTLSKTEKCLGDRELQSTEFSKALNTETNFPGALPGQLTGDDVLPIVQEAFALFIQGKSAAAQLAELRRAMQPAFEREQKAQGVLAAARQTLAQSEAQLNVLRNEHSVLSMKLSRLQTEREVLESQKSMAERELARKKSAYTPVKAEIDPLLRAVVKERGELNTVTAEIGMHESWIRSSELQINGLRAEWNRLSNSIASLNSEISSLEREKSQVDRRYYSFDVNSEARRILDSDYMHRNALFSLRAAENDLRDVERDYRRADNDANRAQRELNQCRSARKDGSDNGVRNCSFAEQSLQRALSDKHRANREKDRARSNIRQSEFRIGQAESSARREAQVVYERISRERAGLERELRQRENRKVDMEVRRGRIISSEIPQSESVIANSRGALPNLRYRQTTERTEYTRAYEAWSGAVKRLEFERLENEFKDASAAFESVESKLVNNALRAGELTKARTQLKSSILESENVVVARVAACDQALTTLTSIQTELVSHRQSEWKLVSEVERTKAGIIASRAVYQAMYDQLTQGL